MNEFIRTNFYILHIHHDPTGVIIIILGEIGHSVQKTINELS